MPKVHAYAGFRYPERPRAFEWEGTLRRVERVLAEWRTPQEHCFRVRCPDGSLFEMCYRPEETAWSLRETAPNLRQPASRPSPRTAWSSVYPPPQEIP